MASPKVVTAIYRFKGLLFKYQIWCKNVVCLLISMWYNILHLTHMLNIGFNLRWRASCHRRLQRLAWERVLFIQVCIFDVLFSGIFYLIFSVTFPRSYSVLCTVFEAKDFSPLFAIQIGLIVVELLTRAFSKGPTLLLNMFGGVATCRLNFPSYLSNYTSVFCSTKVV